MPPRTPKSPVTSIQRGRAAATKSSMMRFVTSSWNAPSLRYDQRYSLSDLSSTRCWSGTYRMRIVAKSGCPVIGQRQVNSGAVICTS